MQTVQDDYLYTAYTSYFSGELDKGGRAAMFQCNSDAEFAIDMTGVSTLAGVEMTGECRRNQVEV